MARPKVAKAEARPLMQTAKWIWPAYYAISVYFVVSGIADLVRGLVLMNKHNNSAFGQELGLFAVIGLVVAGIELMIGIGLLAKIDLIRGIVNVFCWLQIVSSAFGLLGSVLAGGFFTGWGILGIVINVFNIVTAGLMIYLIGETD